ncbi:unnamed protein product [Penicillium pancosmium]
MAKFECFLPPASAKKKQGGIEEENLLGKLHFAQSQEFGLRRQVRSSLEVLRSATVNAARMLRQDKLLGEIFQSFAADLLIMNANPLEDLTILDGPEKNVLATLKDGLL